MKRSHRALVFVFGALAPCVLPASAGAVGASQQRTGQASFDARSAAPAVGVVGAAARRLARSLGPQGIVDVDQVTGTPRQVARTDGTLTGPSDRAPAQIALDYVRTHADVFGLSDADLAALAAPRDYVSIDGTHHLRWTQRIDGVPVLGGELRAHVTADGRLLAVQGSPVEAPTLAGPSAPRLGARDALGRLRRDAGASGAAPRVTSVAGGAQRRTRFADDSQARLVAFAGVGGNRLAWQVRSAVDDTHVYAYVVDAATGAVLKRDNLVRYAGASGYGSVWQYAPSPTLAGGFTRRSLEPFGDRWVTSFGGRAAGLSGNNAHTFSDLNDNDTAAPGEEVSSTGQFNTVPTWDPPYAPSMSGSAWQHCSTAYPCTWTSRIGNTWATNRAQNATQVFYFVNQFHDHLKDPPIGFDEAAGNFQVDNGSAGGLGGDPVMAQNDDGANLVVQTNNGPVAGHPDIAHTNNANMSTLPDGESPTMQMYLFADLFSDAPIVDANGGDDASVVYHEYTHGLSNRLITDSTGYGALDSIQSGAMGEAWSDWYAMDYLVKQGLQADSPSRDGDIVLGAYLTQGQNYLRTESLDCTVGVPSANCPAGGYTYADFGKVIPGGPEVHADGEIWGQTLWDLRKAVGSSDAESLITRAMELSPDEPSFLDMRNAILIADQERGGGEHDLIWNVFKARGMGYFAGTEGSSDPVPFANFDPPPSTPPTATLSGTVTDAATVGAIANAVVWLPGFQDRATQTDASGHYTLSGVPSGTYPRLVASHDGYADTLLRNVAVADGASSVQDVALRRDWALASGGATIVARSDPDLTDLGCGPGGAIDGSHVWGWGSYQPGYAGGENGLPAAQPGDRSIELQLPQAVDLTSFEIDPAATCGDDDSAALGSYRIETSTDRASWTTSATGQFTPADNHRLNPLAAGPGTTNGVRYVRLTMLSPQGATTDPSGSAAAFMDATELAVYGSATAPPAPLVPPAPKLPATDTRPPRLELARLVLPRRHGLAKLLSRAGLPLRLRCDERFRANVTATIPARTARRLGLTKRRDGTVTIARTASRWIAAERTSTLRITVSRKIARRLRRARAITVTVRVTVTDAARNPRTRTLRATLRR